MKSYIYQVRAKSKAWKVKIDKAVTKLPELQEKVFYKRELQYKDQILRELYDMLKVVYKGVNMPCSTVARIQLVIHQIFYLSGNLSRCYKSRAHMSAVWKGPSDITLIKVNK